MKKIIFVLLFLFWAINPSNTFCQGIEWEEIHNYNSVETIEQTNDGGFIVGSRESFYGTVGYGSADYWITKMDILGNIEWEQNYGGSEYDIINSIQKTNDLGYVLGGITRSSNQDVGGNNGQTDGWLVKIDELGNLEWEQNFGGASYEKIEIVRQTNDGGFIAGGVKNTIKDYWVVKMDALGNLEWEQTYGGSDWEYLFALEQTNDGGFIMGGYTSSTDGDVSVNYGDSDYWVVKTDAMGNIEWEKNYGGTYYDVGVKSIIQTDDGGFVFAGSTEASNMDVSNHNGSYDYWIVKTDVLGNIGWTQTYGGSTEDHLIYMEQMNDGGFIMGGYTLSSNGDIGQNYGDYDYWIVKIDENGVLQWEQNYGGSQREILETMRIINDGGFILAGTSSSLDGDINNNSGGTKTWIVKLNSFNDCVGNITIDANTVLETAYEAGQIEIVGNVSISSSDAITLKSNDITINQEFEIKPNGVFCVYSVPCNVVVSTNSTND